MADDLAALRRRQKEERRRKREEEWKNARAGSQPTKLGNGSSGRSCTSRPPLGHATRNIAAGVGGGEGAGGDDTEYLAERKRRHEEWKAERKRQEGARLIRELYPDTVNMSTVNTSLLQSPAKGSDVSCSVSSTPSVGTSAAAKESPVTLSSPAPSIPRQSTVKTIKASGRVRTEDCEGPSSSCSWTGRLSRPLHYGLGSQTEPRHCGAKTRNLDSFSTGRKVSVPVPASASPRSSLSASSSPIKRILFQHPGLSQDSDGDELLVASSKLEKSKEELRQRKKEQVGDDLMAVARALEKKKKKDNKGDDLLAAARALDLRKKKEGQRMKEKDHNAHTSDLKLKPHSAASGPGHKRSASLAHESCDSDDIIEIAKKLEAKKKRQRQEAHEEEQRKKEREKPRNPIVAMRRQEEEVSSARKEQNNSSAAWMRCRRREIDGLDALGRADVGFCLASDEELWDTSGSDEAENDTKEAKSNETSGKKCSEGVDQVRKQSSKESKPREKEKERTKSDNEISAGPLHIDVGTELPAFDDDEGKDLVDQLKPEFSNPNLGPPSALVPLVLSPPQDLAASTRASATVDEVPASINRYLQHYQREGIQFMHSALTSNKGAILGDDMGLGKTVQVIALLAALLKKTGTGKDKMEVQKRRTEIAKELTAKRAAADQALLTGKAAPSSVDRNANNVTVSARCPILVVVPPSVIRNWQNEFNTWGHFAVEAFQDKERVNALERVRNGMAEVLICGRALFSQPESFALINTVLWKLVVVDEFHEYKNQKGRSHVCLELLKSHSKCPMIGMTGTLMQNSHKELWNLINLAQPGLLGDWKSFHTHTSRPIMLARTKTAQQDVLELGQKRQQDLDNALKCVFLERKKSDVLKKSLTKKDEKVIFCELSEIQKRIYRHILSLPDFLLLRMSTAPCSCGVNQKFFLGYKQMRTKREQVDYQRRHKNELVLRKNCCYQIPLNPKRFDEGQPRIDCDAVLWRTMHDEDEMCDKCPTCMLLPALHKLYKVCSHASLLQAVRPLESIEEGTAEWKKVSRVLEFAQVALEPDILPLLPGGSYIREDGIMDDHMALSGKMRTLDHCLNKFQRRHDRVLIFSYSTATLDIIQNYVKAKGYSFLRLDGKTQTKKRQALVDEFQTDNNIFLFLISTKAGGLGLNLTAANRVIVYDVNWNPSYDEQAQDRAFRIGQNRDVDVIRLVARGTIEELMYVRQVYKVQLKQETLGGGEESAVPRPARMFRGVAGDTNRKGELFGLENLLKFKDGSFMADLWKSTNNSNEMHNVSKLASTLSKMTSEQIETFGTVPGGEESHVNEASHASPESSKRGTNKEGSCSGESSIVQGEEDNHQHSIDPLIEKQGIQHDAFFREDLGGAALNPGDEGFDEEMGGASQIVHVVSAIECEHIPEIPEGGSFGKKSTRHLEPVLEEAEADPCTMQQVDKKPSEYANGSTGQQSEILTNDTCSELNAGTKNNKKQPKNYSIADNSTGAKKLDQHLSLGLSPALPCSRPMKVAVMGSVPKANAQKNNQSLFSALDLHVPTYQKKKKKRKNNRL